jgi:hypothetical protein
MNQMLVALLSSAALVACGGKKESTAPVNKDRATDKATMEHKDEATGGAAYGGKHPGGAAGDAANPCAPK